MQNWDLKTVEAEPHQPQILASGDDARTIVLHLPAGEELSGRRFNPVSPIHESPPGAESNASPRVPCAPSYFDIRKYKGIQGKRSRDLVGIHEAALSGVGEGLRSLQLLGSAARPAEELRLDEHDQRVGPNAVVLHRSGSLLGLHQCLKRVHVRNVCEHRRAVRVLPVEERSDADSHGSEMLLTLG